MENMGKTEVMCLNCLCVNCRCAESEKTHDEEMDAYRQSFEDFLVDKHAEQYVGLDDSMPDACDDFVSFLETHEIMELAEEYGKKCFNQGRKVGR